MHFLLESMYLVAVIYRFSTNVHNVLDSHYLACSESSLPAALLFEQQRGPWSPRLLQSNLLYLYSHPVKLNSQLPETTLDSLFLQLFYNMIVDW